MFSHRIHRIHRTDLQRCSPTEFTEFTEQTGRDVLPQNSQILTDGVCLEFCEFCVFCGTSHAPVNLCKSVQSVGGLFWLRGALLCWCLLQGVQQSLLHQPSKQCTSARLVHLRQVHPLQCYEGRGVHTAQQVAVEQCAGGTELVDIAVGGVGAGIRCVHVGGAGRYVQRVG